MTDTSIDEDGMTAQEYARMERLFRRDVEGAFQEWLKTPGKYQHDESTRKMDNYQSRWMAGRPMR